MPPRRKQSLKKGAPKKNIVGLISINRRGTGYVAWPQPEGAQDIKIEKKQDIEVPTQYLNGALNGDEVEIEVKGLSASGRPSRDGFPRPQGAVVAVAKRAKETFVATIKRDGHQFLAVAADLRFYKPIEIQGGENFDEGEKVLVRLVSFSGSSNPTGVVEQHIGKAGEHRVEMNAIVLEHGF